MIRFSSLLKPNKWFYSSAVSFSKSKPAQRSSNEAPIAEIEDLIQKMPELQKFSKAQWQATYETLLNQGFRTSNFVRVIRNRPELMKRSPEKLVQSLNCLREIHLGDKNTIALIETHPEILEYDNVMELKQKFAYLRAYVQSQKAIFRLFLLSPNLITDDEEVIEEKIEYFEKVMNASVHEVTKSTVFSHPISVIKCRHVFLARLGLYKPKSPKEGPLQPSKNPKMREIYDTSDQEFATKTCLVSLDEFQTFQELYRRELDEEDKYDERSFSSDGY